MNVYISAYLFALLIWLSFVYLYHLHLFTSIIMVRASFALATTLAATAFSATHVSAHLGCGGQEMGRRNALMFPDDTVLYEKRQVPPGYNPNSTGEFWVAIYAQPFQNTPRFASFATLDV